MRKFLYRAKNNKGMIVTGTVKAENKEEAEKILLKHNLVPTDIFSENSPTGLSFLKKRISIRDRAVFSRQLATMLSSGLPLTKAISILAKQARNDHQKEIFLDIYKDLEEGYSFSSSLSKHPEAFDRVYVSVVNSGESTGKLDVVLNELSDQLESDSAFISKVKGSLYYPSFIIIALIGAGILMLTMVIPQIKGMFEQANQELPFMTKLLLGLSSFMTSFWWLVLLMILGLVLLVRYFLQTENGSKFFHRLLMRVPIVNKILEGMYMFRFARVMSMLIGAGVPLLEALKIGGAVISNPLYSESITKAVSQVEKGIPLSEQLINDPLFPKLVGQMAAVGEETGELNSVLAKVADYYERSTDDMTKSLSSLIEPGVLLFVGIAVAFIVFSVYLPLFQMSQIAG